MNGLILFAIDFYTGVYLHLHSHLFHFPFFPFPFSLFPFPPTPFPFPPTPFPSLSACPFRVSGSIILNPSICFCTGLFPFCMETAFGQKDFPRASGGGCTYVYIPRSLATNG